MIEPVRRSITVEIEREAAFRLFTTGMGSWWPVDTHGIAADDGGDAKTERLVFEERQGGHIIEVLSTGEECTWGHVLVWEPPDRVAFDWNPSREQRPFTEVEVTFSAAADGGTRVDLEHRGWEALGADLGQVLRDGYEPGWGYVFGERFGGAASPGPVHVENRHPSFVIGLKRG